LLGPAAGGLGCCAFQLLLVWLQQLQRRQQQQLLQVWHLKLHAALLLLLCWPQSKLRVRPVLAAAAGVLAAFP
jgi:hypothetical protein